MAEADVDDVEDDADDSDAWEVADMERWRLS